MSLAAVVMAFGANLEEVGIGEKPRLVFTDSGAWARVRELLSVIGRPDGASIEALGFMFVYEGES
jgi:hypothetical protein